jgi:NAD(P)-dependent dehydrogenase (short-subunit alcohol dehydrogenase family)
VPTTFIGTGSADAGTLALALGAAPSATSPEPPAAATWDWDWRGLLTGWRSEVAALPAADQVVVCTWPDPAPRVELLELGPVRWRREVEWPTALWFTTLAVATGRCRDGGAIVVVVDRPAPLDAPGHGAAVTVGDGVVNLVRSLAGTEGGRGVRVNAVLSARPVAPRDLAGSPTPLTTSPGRVDVEIAGAVRMLLSDDGAGLTGTVLPATGGHP